MVPGSDMAGLSTAADAAPAITWRGALPRHAALITELRQMRDRLPESGGGAEVRNLRDEIPPHY